MAQPTVVAPWVGLWRVVGLAKGRMASARVVPTIGALLAGFISSLPVEGRWVRIFATGKKREAFLWWWFFVLGLRMLSKCWEIQDWDFHAHKNGDQINHNKKQAAVLQPNCKKNPTLEVGHRPKRHFQSNFFGHNFIKKTLVMGPL